jgi:hypothetical protein
MAKAQRPLLLANRPDLRRFQAAPETPEVAREFTIFSVTQTCAGLGREATLVPFPIRFHLIGEDGAVLTPVTGQDALAVCV